VASISLLLVSAYVKLFECAAPHTPGAGIGKPFTIPDIEDNGAVGRTQARVAHYSKNSYRGDARSFRHARYPERFCIEWIIDG
jgi:hypothetical protein